MLHFVLLLNLCVTTHAELFTAITDVEYLLETHKRIIDDFDYYVDKEERRLSVLKRHLNIYKTEHEKAMEDIPNYLGNPINAFTLIKRLTTDLEHIKDNINLGKEYINNVTIKHEDVKYPDLEDLTGAAQALTRLQETYNLDVNELAEGKLNGVAYSTPMSAGDCYELGRVLYHEANFTKAREWMAQALRKYHQENMPYPFNDTDILNYLQETGTEQRVDKPTNGKETYEALCRGDMTIPVRTSSRLTCRYLTENHPFLKIAPIKMEMMYLEPDVILFRDVLFDSEIESIKQLSRPRLKRAGVKDKTGKGVPASYRVSKSAWLSDTESETIARISRRVTHMTGLSMESAEDLQIANYGIGGHYEPHYDFTRMSDVAQGGATVFTELGLSVFPVKGAAAYWLNLHASGEGDLATRHAACPVLQGSKWVCNKWIHQLGQELLRPCNLEYQDEAIIRKLPRPVPRSAR